MKIINTPLLSATLLVAGLSGLYSLVSASDRHDYDYDFGMRVQQQLYSSAEKLFGFERPLQASASADTVVARADATADQRLLLAKGLEAEFVARNLSHLGDMMSFWPSAQAPTHLVICIEQGRNAAGNNASLQRVELDSGKVETILYGMSRCDGIRTTDWGTVLATEETDDGRAYEIINPLQTTGHWVADRSTGDIRDGINSMLASQNIVQRQALPTMAWEGLTVLESGVVIGGDELRPGTGTLDSDGGAIFKFVPSSPRNDNGNISSLADSPLATGNTYALQVSCRDSGSSSFPQYGQGCEVGHAAWVKVDALNARSSANTMAATGYYRPEDLHRDMMYAGKGVRFCWTNTGNESAAHYAEVVCGVDHSPVGTGSTFHNKTAAEYLADSNQARGYAVAEVNRFVEGDSQFNSFDNLAFQPGTGNLYVVEDHSFGDIIACLPDGRDQDIKSDGCVRAMSVNDLSAEPTGFIFDASGEVAYVVIQHGEQDDSLLDFDSNPVDGRTDDLIRITGFK